MNTLNYEYSPVLIQIIGTKDEYDDFDISKTIGEQLKVPYL